METNDQQKQMDFNENTIKNLNELRKWTNFISIVGFIFIGLLIILIPTIFLTQGPGSHGPGGALTLVPLAIVMVIYFFPIYFLFMFSKHMKKAIEDSDNSNFETSFKYLKFHYRFMGILIIVMLGIYLIAGIIMLISKAIL